MKKLIAGLALASLFIAACGGTGQNNADGNTVVTIGAIMPLSGDVAAYGVETRAVVEHALPELNAQYADSGYQFEVVYEDGRCDGVESTTAFQKLTEVDGVDFVFGGLCSSESLAIAAQLEGKDVLAISALSSSPELDGASNQFHSLSYQDSVVGVGVAEQLAKYSKVAFLTEDNDFNTALAGVALDTLKADYPEVEVVANETFPKGVTEVRTLLNKIRAAEPEVLFLNPNGGTTIQAAVKQFAELEWDVEVVSQVFLNEDVIALAPEAFEGSIVVDAPIVDNPEVDALFNTIEAKGQTLTNIGKYYTASTYDGLDLMMQLIIESENDPVAATQAVKTGVYEGYLGEISFKGKTFLQGIGTSNYLVEGGKLAVQ